MGVFAFGPSVTSIDIEGMAEGMRPSLEMWMNAHIKIIDPQRQTSTKYDPTADTGGTAAEILVLDSGANGAIIQPIRSPSRIDVGGQANGLLGIRFQFKRNATSMQVGTMRGGLLVQVVDGGNAPIPSTWRFGLAEAIDSSLMWDHIYDATLITGG